ncbi:hypothetical protein ACHAQA_009220 [Verticillium albo-atrum]
MPPKKSSPANPSASAARFVPMDEDTPAAPNPLPTTEAADTSLAADAGAPAPRSDDKPDKASSKDKEKEKEKDRDAVTIEDLTLPRSIITRLAKGVLPPNTQVQANAILALNKSAAVFVNYLATHANEHTLNAGKKTIDPTHVFKALEDTELSFLREPLEAEFAKYAQTKSEKRIDYRRRQRQGGNPSGSASAATGDDSHMGDVSTMSAPGPDDTLTTAAPGGGREGEGEEQEHRPRAKKAKIAAGAGAGAAAVVAGGAVVVAAEGDETEPEEAGDEDGDETDEAEEDDDEEEEEEEEDDEEEGGSEAEETVDALEGEEDRAGREEEADEALDGGESD